MFWSRTGTLRAAVSVAVIFGLASYGHAGASPDDDYMPAPPEAKASSVQPWKAAPAEWGEMLQFYTKNNIFPGVSILIKSPKWGVRFVSAGSPILEKPEIPFKPTTQFRIGSCSKAMVAMVILQLDYEHKLNLDDPIIRHLPASLTSQIPNAEEITIRHCLNMTSGLRSYTDIPQLGDPQPETAMDFVPPEELLSMAMNYNSYVFKPGESEDGEIQKYDYSNTGYLICGLIAQLIDKKPLHEILDERVFKKIGMTDTYLAQDHRITRRTAYGYTAFYETGQWNYCSLYNQSVPWAAGAVMSTPFDLLNFYESAFTKDTLIQPVSRRKWLQMNYAHGHKGYGAAVLEEITPSGSMLGHGGTILGYLTLMLYSPDRDFYYISYINTWDNKYTRAEVFTRIAYLALGSPEEPAPADGGSASIQNGALPLAWCDGDLDGETYHVYVGEKESSVFSATVDKHPDVSFDIVRRRSLAKMDLKRGKRYYWRVDAHHKRTDREISTEREDIEVLMSNFNTYVYREIPDYVTVPGPVWTFTAK